MRPQHRRRRGLAGFGRAAASALALFGTAGGILVAGPVTRLGHDAVTVGGSAVASAAATDTGQVSARASRFRSRTALAAPTAAPATAPSAPGLYGMPDVSGLKRQADLTRTRLLEGTRAYEEAARALADTRAEAARVRAQADAAARAVAVSRLQLESTASAAYRNPVSADLTALLLSSREQDTGALLSSAGWLDRVGADQNEAVDRLLAAQDKADALAEQADRLTDSARAEAAEQADRVAALRAQANQAAVVLGKAVAAYAVLGCDPTVSIGSGGKGAWGGFPNGLIPASVMCRLYGAKADERLRRDAALAFNAMSRDFQRTFGRPLCVGDAYRSYAQQVAVYAQKPGLAAVPGNSNHGWGLAVDFCGAEGNFGTAPHTWLYRRGGAFGWHHPAWAEPGGSKPEPWHWEFSGSAASSAGALPGNG